MAIGRQDYVERRERKIELYTNRASKANAQANKEINNARNMGSVIPFGQPILVGHHSEGRHRALLKKIDNAHRKASEAFEKSEYYENKAQAAENNKSISGDNPEAMAKYQEKLKKLEEAQEYMKSINKAWKQGKAALMALGLSETKSEELVNEKSKPIATWQLSNNSAEIRRVKQQIETLKKLDNMEAQNIKFKGGEMVVNVEINRIQLFFDEIPAPEIRSLLKSNGFKWARSQGAWQRQRTINAINTTRRIIEKHLK